MNNTELRIKKIIAKQFGTSIENIKTNEPLLSNLDGDSLDIVELLLAIEDEFSIEIPEEIAVELDNVDKVVEYIQKVGAADNLPNRVDKNDVLW